MFPFQSDIRINDHLLLNYEIVLDKIYPLLTEERRQRINQVVPHRCFDITIVMEGIYDRGNISAVLRTGEGFGFADYMVVENQAKFKEANRVTKGADKWVELGRYKETSSVITRLRSQKKKIVVSALTPKAKPIDQIDFSQPTALVLGNEKEGVSQEILDEADEIAIVPMVGFVQSFNISVAAALCISQIQASRIRVLGKNADVNPEQHNILKAVYALRSLDSAQDILRQFFQREA